MRKRKVLSKKSKVEIEFDNPKAAEHFLSWLCGQGEQNYWLWMECREQEEKGNITAISFDYKFKQLTASTKCGRLDGKQ
jgi:hypothetical protein